MNRSRSILDGSTPLVSTKEHGLNGVCAGYELDAEGACAQLDAEQLLEAAEDKGLLQFTLSRGMALAYNPSFNAAGFNNDHSRFENLTSTYSQAVLQIRVRFNLLFIRIGQYRSFTENYHRQKVYESYKHWHSKTKLYVKGTM